MSNFPAMSSINSLFLSGISDIEIPSKYGSFFPVISFSKYLSFFLRTSLIFWSHFLNKKGPVPIGFCPNSSPKFSTTSLGTTEQYFILKIPRKGLNSFVSSIFRIESLTLYILSTFFRTHDPDDATLGSVNLFKL